MKTSSLLILFLIVTLTSGCNSTSSPDCTSLLTQIENDVSTGNLKKAILLADSLKRTCTDRKKLIQKADSLAQIAERIAVDFSMTEEEVVSRLNKSLGSISPGEKDLWEKKGWLEWKLINGEKRYFNRAASNLILIKNFNLDRAHRDTLIAHDKEIIFRKNHIEKIIKTSGLKAIPVIPVEMKIEYTLSIKPDAVPDGETVRCWLPWPREDNPRQKKVSLISTSQPVYIISPDSAIHRTIYMESKTQKGLPLVFRVSYSYRSSGQYFDMRNLTVRPYDRSSPLYKRYTSEQLPQICFTDNVRHLADSIAGNESNPSEIVRKIFSWFRENIPWAGSLEYTIMPNIPEYVLRNKRGDCGMQTFLLMSMLRYKGIPVKWQSGWMMPPEAENLHDWCEVYYEGIGWVPADISYGLQFSPNAGTKEFYTSGIDSYRLIINDGISGVLYPEKKFLRSEPFDFQRGEVEWNGGNLYFDKWNYNMKIEYLVK